MSQQKSKHTRTVPAVSARFSWKPWLLCAVISVCVAAMIRLPKFGEIPLGLNRDEAALGYNAYSLLKTGKDEFGKPWPVSITSFGDQKLPGYVYTLIPLEAVFGLNVKTVRLPSLISGFAIVIEAGILALWLARSVGLSKKAQTLMSGLTMLFLAISPWADHFSRVAYEAHEAMACFLFAVISYTIAISSSSKKIQRLGFILAASAWSMTLLTYHSYHIVTPLMTLGLFFLDFKKLKKADVYGLVASVAIGAATVALLYFGGVIQANKVKSQGINPFHGQELAEMANRYRAYLPWPGTAYTKLISNTYVEGAIRFSTNIVSIFSGEFFFIAGSNHGDHDPGHTNNFSLFLAPLLPFGFIFLWQYRGSAQVRRIVAWFLAGLVAPSLTIQPQHEVRLSPMFSLVSVFGAAGATLLLIGLKNVWLRRLCGALLVGVVLLSGLRTFVWYTDIIPSQLESNYHWHQLAKVLNKYQQQGFEVITQSPSSSPYIWYLFENKYDPQKLSAQIERYPADKEGFLHVKRIGDVYFETIQWDDLKARAQQRPLILVFQPKEVQVEILHQGLLKELETIRDEHGDVYYKVWEMGAEPATASAQTKHQ